MVTKWRKGLSNNYIKTTWAPLLHETSSVNKVLEKMMFFPISKALSSTWAHNLLFTCWGIWRERSSLFFLNLQFFLLHGLLLCLQICMNFPHLESKNHFTCSFYSNLLIYSLSQIFTYSLAFYSGWRKQVILSSIAYFH